MNRGEEEEARVSLLTIWTDDNNFPLVQSRQSVKGDSV